MIKLYKLDGKKKFYWETWQSENIHTVHWGELGDTGETKEMKANLSQSIDDALQEEMNLRISEGYATIDGERLHILLIEYQIDGFGTKDDLEKRYRLQDRMDETLGWTGLGHCDGGSSGSNTMEACCFVVDFDLAKMVIENDLKETEFSDFTRIYNEADDE